MTFKFIPQPGYQLKSASLNGFILAPQEEECTFNIVMGGLLHVTGAFVEASNQIDLGEGTVVSGADVEGTGGIDKGTIAASFENTAVPADSVITGAMGDQSEDFIESVGSLDINLTQIISKGGTDDYSTNSGNYWATPVSELEEAVDMSLSLPADDLEDGETYGIVRQHGNDTELLDATYNSTLGTLTFESDRFSTYTSSLAELLRPVVMNPVKKAAKKAREASMSPLIWAMPVSKMLRLQWYSWETEMRISAILILR